MAILSGIVEHGKLVSKRKWEHYVARLKKQTILIVSGKQKAKKQLEEKLVLAVSSRLPKKRFGIFFRWRTGRLRVSGGGGGGRKEWRSHRLQFALRVQPLPDHTNNAVPALEAALYIQCFFSLFSSSGSAQVQILQKQISPT